MAREEIFRDYDGFIEKFNRMETAATLLPKLPDGYMYRSILSRIRCGDDIREIWSRKDGIIRLLYKAE